MLGNTLVFAMCFVDEAAEGPDSHCSGVLRPLARFGNGGERRWLAWMAWKRAGLEQVHLTGSGKVQLIQAENAALSGQQVL